MGSDVSLSRSDFLPFTQSKCARSHLSDSQRKKFLIYSLISFFLWVKCGRGSLCAGLPQITAHFSSAAPVKMCPAGLVRSLSDK